MKLELLLAFILGVLSVCLAGKRKYGEECSAIAVFPGSEEDVICNEKHHLKCVDNKCACDPNGFVYDGEINVLGYPVWGGSCKLKAHSLRCEWIYIPCVSNSRCTEVCVCNEGFKVNEDTGKCDSEGGENISTTPVTPVVTQTNTSSPLGPLGNLFGTYLG